MLRLTETPIGAHRRGNIELKRFKELVILPCATAAAVVRAALRQNGRLRGIAATVTCMPAWQFLRAVIHDQEAALSIRRARARWAVDPHREVVPGSDTRKVFRDA